MVTNPNTTSTTLADTVLTAAVVSGTVYRFKAVVIFKSSVITTGVGLALSFPSVTTFAATSRIPNGANTEQVGTHSASNDVNLGLAVAAANTNYVAVIEGIIKPSANGSLTVRFKSSVGATTITLAAGSWLEVQAIG